MTFYVPGAPTAAEGESIYVGICRYNGKNPSPQTDRVEGVRWRHEDHEHMAKVGRRLDGYKDGEIVIAILESSGDYLVCTQNNGVLTGEPIKAPRADIVQVWKFQIA